MNRHPTEELDKDDDDGVMPDNLADFAGAVIGRRIASVEQTEGPHRWGVQKATIITLDNGNRVRLVDTSDCCAFTELEAFLLHPERIDHIITGVGTTDGYTRWHVYADAGDILELMVGWSCGNPFYYGYGFDIIVEEVESPAPESPSTWSDARIFEHYPMIGGLYRHGCVDCGVDHLGRPDMATDQTLCEPRSHEPLHVSESGGNLPLCPECARVAWGDDAADDIIRESMEDDE